jgi:hypothetical protein
VSGFVLLIPLFAIVALALRLVAGAFDHDRVRQYVEARGGRVIEVRWSPFGPGWFAEKSDRIYAVRYRDESGDEHHAYCKTGMWTGVYLTRDEITRRADRADKPQESLEEENRRLRAELDRLRGEQG